MCRLFGLTAGRTRVRATFWLLDAPDSLEVQGVPMSTRIGQRPCRGRFGGKGWITFAGPSQACRPRTGGIAWVRNPSVRSFAYHVRSGRDRIDEAQQVGPASDGRSRSFLSGRASRRGVAERSVRLR